MKVIIVGAHGEAKELINRISSGWSISVIDLDQDKLRNFSTNRQIEKIQGDATSSLVLKINEIKLRIFELYSFKQK